MATLVLSTVGTIFGGPIGGALGSIVGQAIDQNLFGPPVRRGPRLGDLRAQTSSYGTPIPRVYGRMRVAGTVVWATDLIEEEVTTGGGKGAPGAIGYAYSASFAVVLSSRPAVAVGRIWADGKLLRGSDGDFKSKVRFRFLPGSEEQAVDPMIASIEGADGSPAFRGLALALFEDFALADYGNRIPSLTFELIADPVEPEVAAIIADVSRGMIEQGVGGETLTGFAALGSDRRSAIEPLVELWGGRYYDDGERVRTVPDAAVSVIAGRERMGCSAGGEAQAISERQQEPADALPAALTIDYYDPERDYQAGQMRASVGAGGRWQQRIDSAAAMSGGAAKMLASDALARRWAGRDRVTLRLSPDHLGLRPGELVSLPPVPGVYRISDVTIDGLVVIVEARRTHLPGGILAGDPGRSNRGVDVAVGESIPYLIDLPPLPGGAGEGLSVGLALGCRGAFKPTAIELLVNGQPLDRVTVMRAATTGRAAMVLGTGQAQLVDQVNSVEVQCDNPDALLFHADQNALAMGANAAIIGHELIQFGRAEALGGGRYRLSGLLRGRRGSEWAMAGHAANEPFVLIDPPHLTMVALDPAMVGGGIEARAYGVADDELDPPTASVAANGESLRPLSVCHLRGEMSSAGLMLSWVPRRVEAFAWAAVDPNIVGMRFSATITRGGTSSIREASTPNLHLTAAELTGLGSGPVSIVVSEIAAGGASRPTQIILPA